jgi:acyl carrier protein
MHSRRRRLTASAIGERALRGADLSASRAGARPLAGRPPRATVPDFTAVVAEFGAAGGRPGERLLSLVLVATYRKMNSYETIRRDVAEFLATNYDIALDSLAPEATLEDLGFDSLGMFSVMTLLENKHGLRFEGAMLAGLRTVGDLLALLRAQSSGA